LLPLNEVKLNRIAVIGPNADTAIIQGGGSSQVLAAEFTTPLQAIRNLLANSHTQVSYQSGVDNELLPPMLDMRYFSPGKDRKQQGLQARYYGNDTWSGKSLRSRVETNIGGLNVGSDIAVHSDSHLSARWTGYFFPPTSGEYEFANDPRSYFYEEDPAVLRIANSFAESLVSTLINGFGVTEEK